MMTESTCPPRNFQAKQFCLCVVVLYFKLKKKKKEKIY